MKPSYLNISIVIAFTLTLLAHLANHYLSLSLSPVLLLSLRWIILAQLLVYGVLNKNLTAWIFIAMLVGIETGATFPDFALNLKVLSKIFLQLIKTIVAPLLFATLVVGIAGHADLKQVGRMGWKSLVYFEIITTVALFIGLAAINISEAGVGATIIPSTEQLPAIKPQNWEDIILHTFPENVAKSIAEGQILQIVVFSVLFGIGLAMVKKDEHRLPMLHFAESLSETMFKFTNIIMYFAPVAVFAAIAVTVGKSGVESLKNLFLLLATLYAALTAFILFALVPVMLIIKLPIKKFIQAIAEPVSIAFSTATSEAALPKAMENLEKFGVPRKIVSFVLPTGYSFNLDGSTLYLSLAAVFVAQAGRIDLSFGQQLLIVFTLMLTSKGVAGVPRASLVILLGTATSFGLPTEPILAILGIDALMDMARTSVNVLGNCLAACVVAKWEGELDVKED